MEKLLSVEDAKKFVAGSKERKDELIKKVNSEIESQAKQGHRWSHLPQGMNDVEISWLKDQLCLNGFTINNSNPVINW